MYYAHPGELAQIRLRELNCRWVSIDRKYMATRSHPRCYQDRVATGSRRAIHIRAAPPDIQPRDGRSGEYRYVHRQSPPWPSAL